MYTTSEGGLFAFTLRENRPVQAGCAYTYGYFPSYIRISYFTDETRGHGVDERELRDFADIGGPPERPSFIEEDPLII